MPALTWDESGKRYGETGTKQGVIYKKDSAGKYTVAEAWDGLTGVSTEPEGGEANDNYADDQKYLTLMSAENFKGTIKAFQFPPSFAECDGTAYLDDALKGSFVTGQDRIPFGFSWVTTIVNDDKGTAFGQRVHIAYGCLASPSSQENATINDSPSLKEFSWSFTGTPVPVPGKKPSAYLYFDSRYEKPKVMQKLLEILHGNGATNAQLPTPAELITQLKAAAQ